jgi:hypothetical protein
MLQLTRCDNNTWLIFVVMLTTTAGRTYEMVVSKHNELFRAQIQTSVDAAVNVERVLHVRRQINLRKPRR